MFCLPSFYTYLHSSEQVLDQVLKVQDCDSISNTGTQNEVLDFFRKPNLFFCETLNM